MTVEYTQYTKIKISVSNDKDAYLYNGDYIPIFQDALRAIACERSITGIAKDILLYLLSITDMNNHVIIDQQGIADLLKCNLSTVYRSISALKKMRILCQDDNSRSYLVSSKLIKMINPRLAYRGRITKINKNALPELLDSEGKSPLIPGTIVLPSLPDEGQTKTE